MKVLEQSIVPREIQTIFEGRIFSVRIETVDLPKGGEQRVEVVRHPGSVVLIPITESGDIVLVRQYRHAIGRWLWELPAGSLDQGEDPQAGAARECHEEIGLIPTQMDLLGSFFPTPGYCDEQMHVFRVTGLRRPSIDDAPAEQDADEDLQVRAFPTSAIRRMVVRGEIVDLKTVAGLALLE